MDIPQYGTTWVNLEGIMLSEVITEGQMLQEVSKVDLLVQKIEWWLLAMGGGGNKELLCKKDKVFVIQDE